jgi:hypothetical protein
MSPHPHAAHGRLVGRVLLVALALAGLAAAPFACGDLGDPAFEGQDGAMGDSFDSPQLPVDDAPAEGAAPPLVPLRGTVLTADGGPLSFALVAIEVGGLDQENPGNLGADGAIVPSVGIDPFYQYGAQASEKGVFTLDVPDENIGVHVYASGYYCGVPDGGALRAGSATVSVRPEPLPEEDDGGPMEPIITGFNVMPAVASPGETLTFAVNVEAVDPASDPLSEQILAIEPVTHWAGIFAPSEPGSEEKGYPNGVYSRLVVAPTAPGLYVYYLVAATKACVVSRFAEVRVLVTPTGEGGLPDADADSLGDSSTDALEAGTSETSTDP